MIKRIVSMFATRPAARALVAIFMAAVVTAYGVEDNKTSLVAIGTIGFFWFLVWEASEDE